LGLLLAKLPATRNWKNNLQFFILENFAVYTTFFISLGRLFGWGHSESGACKVQKLQRKQASKSLIINRNGEPLINSTFAQKSSCLRALESFKKV